MRALPPLLLLAAVSSCGYRGGDLMEYPAVAVHILDNLDERRTHEFDLTEAVLRELTARGVRHDPRAPVILQGRIVSITEPSVVEAEGDVVVVGAITFSVEAWVVHPGREISRTASVEKASFSSARAESRETARREVFDRLARWMVSRLEKDW